MSRGLIQLSLTEMAIYYLKDEGMHPLLSEINNLYLPTEQYHSFRVEYIKSLTPEQLVEFNKRREETIWVRQEAGAKFDAIVSNLSANDINQSYGEATLTLKAHLGGWMCA